eukprot:GHVQ01017313.1.p1 GENE.GHVQ01017313.1~~GHVQ01017313.1.p1  ORF type:complete len:211 (-),score=22.40 GHVQ01017313.1:85-717(-)
MGFTMCVTDPCLFAKCTDGVLMFLLFWVDDVVICAAERHTNEVNKFKDFFRNKFDLEDKGKLRWFLEMKIQQMADGSLLINQASYIKELLHNFGLEDCKPISTPCDKGVVIHPPNDAESGDTSVLRYHELVGKLLYLSTTCRPDICFIVNALRRVLAKPTGMHMTMAKRVLRQTMGLSTKEQIPMQKSWKIFVMPIGVQTRRQAVVNRVT